MKLTLCILAFFSLATLAAVGQTANKLPLSLTVKAYESTWQSDAVAPGDVYIEAKLKNVSQRTLTLFPYRLPDYTYEVKRDGVVIPETEAGQKLREWLGRPMVGDTLRPNQTAPDRIPINQFRDMSQPGTYTIQVFWPMNWANPAEGIVKSNIITVKVTP
jgi:hypothetical protein